MDFMDLNSQIMKLMIVHRVESQIVGFKMSDYETYDRTFKTNVRIP